MTASTPTSLGAAAPGGGALVARPKRAGKGRRVPRSQRIARTAVLVLVLGYLILPLGSMVEFSTRGNFDRVTKTYARTLDSYAAIFSNDNLMGSIATSLEIAVLTVLGMLLLLVPTMVWTVVRVPRMRRVVEFLCLLPLAIPAIVIVVGIAPVYRWMGQSLGAVGASPLTLTLIDVILVLPYSYRAIDSSLRSIDVVTLADAARSLGAGWPRTIFQVIVPNIRGGILSASVLAVALVLGEYTISSLLSFNTVQVVIALLGKRDPFISVAVSFAALLFAFVLLFVISRFAPGSRDGGQRAVEEPAA
jgi:putative spermidine/putrescine transport system permease protein